jgi:hypothetical protein
VLHQPQTGSLASLTADDTDFVPQRPNGPVIFLFSSPPFSLSHRRSSESRHSFVPSPPLARTDLTYRPHLLVHILPLSRCAAYLHHELERRRRSLLLPAKKKGAVFSLWGLEGASASFARRGVMREGGASGLCILDRHWREASPLAMILVVNSCSSVRRSLSALFFSPCPVSLCLGSILSVSRLSIIMLVV